MCQCIYVVIMSPLLLILVTLIIANVPWFTERLFLAFQMEKGKSWGWRLLELLVFYFLSLVIATMSEMRFSGDVHPQQWEFFATTFCAFLVLSVPGLIYRYQWLAIARK